MNKEDKRYQTYVGILKKELIPAMGCTEPIALAYCASLARRTLGSCPERILVEASGNIIKNVKSVIVPNTDGKKGIEAAVGVGIIAGDPERGLEVLSGVTDEQKAELSRYLVQVPIQVKPADSSFVLDIIVTVWAEESYAKVRIIGEHTNVVLIEKDGEVLKQERLEEREDDSLNYHLLSIEGIYDFATTADLEDVREVLDRQISYNSAIAERGLREDYGANIGTVLLKVHGNDIRTRAKARAAAGSDARMNGCELPVVINSGSGNQGMTASLPVIEFAREYEVSEETLYRALLISNLCTLHQKTGIGRLSAYCGAVSAGAGAGAGIAFICGGGYNEIAHTIVNALAITSGIICDGAKASCAAKIAMSVEAGILGYDMYQNGQQFQAGDGVISKGVENTIRNIGRLGKDGMRETDKEILKIMTCVD